MRPIRALLLAGVSAFVATTIAFLIFIWPRIKSWGVDPREGELTLPGDSLIAEASATETRGITIDAPVAKVWPWLVQVGYQRAGWYSYDKLDNRGASAEQILPEFQSLKPGDVMPTHPGGGFEVKIVEPERALVLFTDTELMRRQAEEAQAQTNVDVALPALKVSGVMLSASYPDFAASWAFYLEPINAAKTRLIERFRAHTPGNGPATAILGEIMGTGIVLMTRKQMLGIKERVERNAFESPHVQAPTQAPEAQLAPVG